MSIEGTLFESLADMRKWFGQDFNPHLPELKVSRLSGYLAGYLAARTDLESPDILADEFFRWLRERCGDSPDGCLAKLLRDSRGDQVAAIRKFLDLAAEFARLKGLGPI